jgi:transcriptional regulator with XRE-family HTH domain
MKSGMSKVKLARLAKLTPRIIHMIEEDPFYNPSRDTMIRISNALGIPPSVLFFSQEEMEKRQMLSNMVVFCMEAMACSEQEILKKLQEMSISIPDQLPSRFRASQERA